MYSSAPPLINLTQQRKPSKLPRDPPSAMVNPQRAKPPRRDVRPLLMPTAGVTRNLNRCLTNSSVVRQHQQLEQEKARRKLLQAFAENKEDVKTLDGAFSDYEEYGLPGYSSGTTETIRNMALSLFRALRYNTIVNEFTLNLKAIELLVVEEENHSIDEQVGKDELDEGLASLEHFLKNNTSLRVLHLRIPPSSKPLAFFGSLFDARCPSVERISLWVPRERPHHLGLMRLMSHRSRKSSNNLAKSATSTAPRIMNGTVSYDQESSTSYAMGEIASFIASQPRIEHLQLQSSSFQLSQWDDLMKGISGTVCSSKNRSLRHLELRRVEIESDTPTLEDVSGDAGRYLALLAPFLRRLDLHGTTMDTTPLLLAKALNPISSPPLHFLSLSSSKLVNFECLMDILSSPTARLQGLELSHLNLSGVKCQELAEMLRQNSSIRYLDLSYAQLECFDGYHLAQALQDNLTLTTLVAKENHLWRHSDAANSMDALIALGSLVKRNTTLQTMDLSNNGPDKVEEVPNFLPLLQGLRHNTSLRSLILSNQKNAFLDFYASGMSTSSSRSVIEERIGCELDAPIAEALGQILAQDSLHQLVFQFYRLGDDSITEYIAPALASNRNLQTLGLKGAGMGNRGMIALSGALQGHPNLKTLDVSLNPETNEIGYEHLSEMVETLMNLKTLWFHSMSRYREENLKEQYRFTQIIGNALQQNTSLQSFSHSESLQAESRFYLRLNRHGRKALLAGNEESLPSALWPCLLARMPRDVASYYIRRNVTLLSSVSLAAAQPSASTSAKRTRPNNEGLLACSPTAKRHKLV